MENNSKQKGLMVLPVIDEIENIEKLVGFIRLHDLVKSGLNKMSQFYKIKNFLIILFGIYRRTN